MYENMSVFGTDVINCSPTSSGLYNHKKIHSEDRPYPCKNNGCEKSFKRKEHLIKHQKSCILLMNKRINKLTHFEERPFKCDTNGCGKDIPKQKNI